MKKNTVPIILLFMLLITPSVWALQLDVETAVLYACQQSLDVETAELKKQMAFNALETISLLPSVGASLSIASLSDAATASSTLSVDAGISLQWSLSGSYFLEKQQNSITKNKAYTEYDSSVAEVKQKTITAYWSLFELYEAVEDEQAFLDYADVIYTQTMHQYEASQVTELQLAQAKLSLSSAELTLQQAKSTAVENTHVFLDDLGLDRSIALELDELPLNLQLDFTRIDKLVAAYVLGTHAVQSASYALESAKLSQRSTRIDATAPAISAQIATNLQQNSSFSTSTNSLPIQLSASVIIPLDRYLPRSQAATSIKQADADVEIAQLALSSVKKSLIQQAKSLAISLTHQQQNYRILQENFKLSKKALELTTEAYQVGLSSFSDLESVRKALRDTEQTILSAEVSYVLDCYALAWLLNISYENLLRELS